jgi:hypothetical protein
VERSRVRELHFIAPIESLKSIRTHGILCHDLAQELPHRSIANDSVQDIRVGKTVPGGLPLHAYANLYFDARNAMMSVLRHLNPNLVVVRVSPDVLDLPGTVIADGNAARQETRFLASPEGLAHLDADFVFAQWFIDPDPIVAYEKRRRRMAEVLVVNRVGPEHVVGCYVYDVRSARRVRGGRGGVAGGGESACLLLTAR